MAISLAKNEQLVLKYYYEHTIGSFSIPEVFKLLNLSSRDERNIRKELSCLGLIQPVVSNQDGTYYEISEYGKQVHKSLKTSNS